MGETVRHYAYWLETMISKTYEEDEDATELTMSMATAQNLLNLLNSQEIREPMQDVIFFAGKPTKETMCYHVLVNHEDFNRMQKDPNISFMLMKQFNGVMEQVFKRPVMPHFSDSNHAYCGECGKRLRMKYRPSYCPKCGMPVEWQQKGSETDE